MSDASCSGETDEEVTGLMQHDAPYSIDNMCDDNDESSEKDNDETREFVPNDESKFIIFWNACFHCWVFVLNAPLSQR